MRYLCLFSGLILLCQACGSPEAPVESDATRRIEVPEGPFLYGATEDHFDAFLAGSLVGYPGMIEALRSAHSIPPEERTLPAFFIDEFEVTNARFARFVKSTGYAPRDEKDYLRHWDSGAPADWGLEFPVTWISQRDAAAYCEWAGGRLPTEQEWEKAARGTDGRPFPWGEDAEVQINVDSEQLEPVGNRAEDRSPYGVYDMAGNASELTASVDTKDEEWVVMRGGSYLSSLRSAAAFRRALSMKPDTRKQHVGFRCVYDSPAKP